MVEAYAARPEEQATPDIRSRWAPRLMLVLLFAAYVCSTLDRMIIGLLVEPIKADLAISDSEFSLLQGLAFALIYAVATLPVGVLVDRFNRTRLIAAGIAFWSVMTGLCGFAVTFWTLFVARVGVGIGEATLTPSSWSLLSDAFPKRRHGVVLGIFSAGGFLGGGLSMIVGGFLITLLTRYGSVDAGWLGILKPWQTTFILLAFPGFILAALLLLLLREPARVLTKADDAEPQASGGELKHFLTRNAATLSFHHLAVALGNMVLFAAPSWIVPLFMRVHGWSLIETSIGAGLALACGGTAGLLGGGALSDYLMRFGTQARLILCALCVLGAAIAGLFYPMVSDGRLAILLYATTIALGSVPVAVANAALQYITPGAVRGRVSSIYFFCVSIVTLAGPTAIAVIGDTFFPFATGIRYSTAIVASGAFIAAAIFYALALPPYRASVLREVSGHPLLATT